MEYGKFNRDGSQYIIGTPKTPNRWFNYLFNDSYYIEVSQTAQGKSQCLDKGIRAFTRGYRYFYVHDNDTKECWCPTYRPLNRELDSYTCTHALGWTEYKSTYKGIETIIKAFVPTEGLQEVWMFKVKNNDVSEKQLSLYSVYSFENGDPMGSKADLDKNTGILWSFTFPYHVFYEEKEKLDGKNSLIYMFSNEKIASFDCSEKRFFGGDDTTDMPAAILKGGCSNLRSEWDNPLGGFEHKIVLKPGEEKEFFIVVGCGKDLEEAASVKEKYLKEGFVKTALEKVEEYWKRVCGEFTIDTPDKDLNYFINYWLKKQVTLMARNNRLSAYCPVRNQLQDAMGYGMLNPEMAEELMLRVFRREEVSGYIKQWNMVDGSAPRALCLLNHMDGPIWLVSCMCALVNTSGNIDILDHQVEYKDSTVKESVYDHMLRAVYYLAQQTGEHGLCLMGDGDWTDPINGAGRLGKGESTWSTMGLKYAILQLLPFAKKRNDLDNVKKLEEIAQKLDDAINTHCWDGNKAYETIRKTLPTNFENGPDKNLQVPLFVPNFYFGLQDSPNFGQSSNHNSTGTAAWLMWVTLDHMLGAKATVDGLKIAPCVPQQWKEYSLCRRFRNAVYHIDVKNPLGLQVGVKEIYVDGNILQGNVLPYEAGKTYKVEVIIG